MEWILSHQGELWEIVVGMFAVWGVVYAVGLLVVKLTPTPRDDAALEKVNVVVRGIAKALGLTLAQGIRK